MLCPQCETMAPGGSACPSCGTPVPERETFGGQGAHYMWVLALLSATLIVFAWVVAALRVGWASAYRQLWSSRWMVAYALMSLAPLAIGAYYWLLLRDEEMVVTDEYIERRSHWGNQQLLWVQATGFYRQLLPFKQTRLGRIAGLSRVLVDSRLIARLPPYAYIITANPSSSGPMDAMTIEPGSVSDLPWLLKLITAQLGPPHVT